MRASSYTSARAPSPLEVLITQPLYAALVIGALCVATYLASRAGLQIDERRGAVVGAREVAPRFALRPAPQRSLFDAQLWEGIVGQVGSLQMARFRPALEGGVRFEALHVLPAAAWWSAVPDTFFDLIIGADGGGAYVVRLGVSEVAALYALTPERRVVIGRSALRRSDREPVRVERVDDRVRIAQGDRTLLMVTVPDRMEHRIEGLTNAPAQLLSELRLTWQKGGISQATDLLSAVVGGT